MDSKLCRTCGQVGTNFVDIFRTEGLKNKIETCLPIVVSEHCLLPNYLCPKCLTHIKTFYNFTKTCLQNIIILETQLGVQESCLKSRLKQDKSSQASSNTLQNTSSHNLEQKQQKLKEFTNLLLGKAAGEDLRCKDDPNKHKSNQDEDLRHLNYESEQSCPNKRKSNEGEGSLHTDNEHTRKRKCSRPQKFDRNLCDEFDSLEVKKEPMDSLEEDRQVMNAEELLSENGNLDNNLTIINDTSLCDISKAVTSSDIFDNTFSSNQHPEDDPLKKPVKCPNCPTRFTTKTELFVHLRLNHAELSTFLCGICLEINDSAASLKKHVLKCAEKNTITDRYFCQICCFGDDNYRSMENHVLVHNFLWRDCQKEVRIFDPENYIETNPNFISTAASPIKYFSCSECPSVKFDSFKEFSEHRRREHSIFHCDLCSKFYSKNSYLWSHVNKVHKGHPSVTCQICLKMSTTKRLLAQHFVKVHQIDNILEKLDLQNEDENKENVDFTESFKNSPKGGSPSPPPNKLEKQFQCPHCLKSFFMKWTMVKHRRNCHQLQHDAPNNGNLSELVVANPEPVLIKQEPIDQSIEGLDNNNSEIEKNDDFSEQGRTDGIVDEVKDNFQKSNKQINNNALKTEENKNQKQLYAKTGEVCSEEMFATKRDEAKGAFKSAKPSSSTNVEKAEGAPSLPKKNDNKRRVYENDDHPSSCEFCGKTWPGKKHLWQHLLRFHKKEAATVCGICLKSWSDYEELQTHLRDEHPNSLHGQTSGSNFVCQVCGRYHGANAKLQNHMTVHENFDWNIMEKFPPLTKFVYGKKGTAKLAQENFALMLKKQELAKELPNKGGSLDDLIEEVSESDDESDTLDSSDSLEQILLLRLYLPNTSN